MVSEFIEAYSDDQIYINVLDFLVSSDSVESTAPDSIRYSSLSRLFAIVMVGGVECMIKEWAHGSPLKAGIYSYFDKGPNESRLARLESEFCKRGISIDFQAMQDYLAIKYIRNAYVHAEWKDCQREFVVSRGFPKDLMSFDQGHFERMKCCYHSMINNIGMSNALDSMVAHF